MSICKFYLHLINFFLIILTCELIMNSQKKITEKIDKNFDRLPIKSSIISIYSYLLLA